MQDFDTGIFSIYFGCDKDKLTKATSLVKKELEKLKQEPLGIQQLHRAKQQMTGQIAISLENPETLLLSLGKSYLMYGKVDSLETVTERLEAIKADDVQQVAHEIFKEEVLSSLIYY